MIDWLKSEVESVAKVENGQVDEELFDLCREDDYVQIFLVIQQRLNDRFFTP